MSRLPYFVRPVSAARAYTWLSTAALIAGAPAYADELTLRLARELAPPAAKTPTVRTPSLTPAKPTPGAAPAAPEPPRGVVFLRADRLQGEDPIVTAEGNVELRSRYETVLADWLTYDKD